MQERILSNLTAIANGTLWLAALWHVALLAALLAFIRGWRPTRRTAAFLLTLPIVSVAIVSAVFGNPFNTLVFGGLAMGLYAIALRRTEDKLVQTENWRITAGHAFIVFGAFYPHFLDNPLAYAIAAPFGTLPCPTLAVLVGFTLLAGGLSKTWDLTVVGFAVFYGTIGVAQLGVGLDILLVLGGLALAWSAATRYFGSALPGRGPRSSLTMRM